MNITKCAKIVLAVSTMLICCRVHAKSVFDENSQKTLEKSVVMIRCVQQEFDSVTPWKQTAMIQGMGSGFVIEGNRILTNAHNVSNYKYVEVKKQNLPKRYPASVTYVGHDCDLAILDVFDKTFFDDTIALQLGGIPKVNTTVQTYGFPISGRHVSVTEGVISRIQTDIYAHTRADSHLVVQTDAAINPGNSGGPVLQGSKVVGVAFQGLRSADNIGYMIPTTVIEHFLKDIEDKTYDGFGSVGFSFYPGLHNKSYADYLKVPPGTKGVVITKTMMHSSVENILQPDDVLIRIGEYDIDNDAMVRIYGLTLHFGEVVEQKQLGETVELQFYREGKLQKATATVALNRPVLAYEREFDNPPDYYVFAGLTFVPVSRNFLEAWGPRWSIDIPFYLRYLFNSSMQLNTDRERKKYIVLSEILPDKVNSYSGSFVNKVVESVNGVDIFQMSDLPAAFAENKDSFCTIKFKGSKTPLVLDNAHALAENQNILKKYDVPAETNMEDGA